MHTFHQPRPLSSLSGEQLLMMTISGSHADRRRIRRELDTRAVLADSGDRSNRTAHHTRQQSALCAA